VSGGSGSRDDSVRGGAVIGGVVASGHGDEAGGADMRRTRLDSRWVWLRRKREMRAVRRSARAMPVLTVVVLSLGLGGCSGGDSPPGATEAAGTTVAPQTVAPAPAPAAPVNKTCVLAGEPGKQEVDGRSLQTVPLRCDDGSDITAYFPPFVTMRQVPENPAYPVGPVGSWIIVEDCGLWCPNLEQNGASAEFKLTPDGCFVEEGLPALRLPAAYGCIAEITTSNGNRMDYTGPWIMWYNPDGSLNVDGFGQ